MSAKVLAGCLRTLIDTHGVVAELETRLAGSRLRGADFGVAGATSSSRQLPAWPDGRLRASQKSQRLTSPNRALCGDPALRRRPGPLDGRLCPASLARFPDVADALARLERAPECAARLSNGTLEAVEGLLDQAGIRGHFEAVVSVVTRLKRFKPDLAVYAHPRHVRRSSPRHLWLDFQQRLSTPIGARHWPVRGPAPQP
ncbi:HAD family hydrolase [Billgrantia gudaonensis]|uniref:HAD family hydrolase n=1 Tax=Billgrantia gudaonensis TaxID=376427 RepID=A0A432JLN0_9GAMM|nr:HAD family hydrolase [Halomonas gudaonensis]